LAHLAQLTTIYMRGLLGAKYLLTYNQVRNTTKGRNQIGGD
jgi:hypothetical protein